MSDDVDKRIGEEGAHLGADVLSELVDGTLPREVAAAAQAHLRTCASCTEALEGFRAISLLLSGLPEPRLQRSFQLSPEMAFGRGSLIDRLGAWLMPALPALRAATVAIALLLVASIAGDLLTEPSSTGPVMEESVPRVAQTAAPLPTTQAFDAKEPTAAKAGETTNEASLGTNAEFAEESETTNTGAQTGQAIGDDSDTSADSPDQDAARVAEPESGRDGADDASSADALPADAIAPDEDAVAADQAGGAAPAMAEAESASEPVEASDEATEFESVDPAASTSMMAIEPATPTSSPLATADELQPASSPAATPLPTASPTAETALAAPVEVVQGEDTSQLAASHEPESPWWRVAQILLAVAFAACLGALLLSRSARIRAR